MLSPHQTARDSYLDMRESDAVHGPALDAPDDPDTSPAGILAAHRAVVAAEHPLVLAAWLELGCVPDAAQLADSLSHATDLPPWNVRRALEFLSLGAPVRARRRGEKAAEGSRLARKLVNWLQKQTTYMTLGEIAAGARMTPTEVRKVAEWVPSPLVRVPWRKGTRRVYAYQLRGFKGAELLSPNVS